MDLRLVIDCWSVIQLGLKEVECHHHSKDLELLEVEWVLESMDLLKEEINSGQMTTDLECHHHSKDLELLEVEWVLESMDLLKEEINSG